MNEFSKEFDRSMETFSANWAQEFNTFISEIITPYGLCFNFNMAQSHDLLNLNSTSDDFHYQLTNLQYWDNQQDTPPELPRKTLNWTPIGVSISIMTYPDEIKEMIDNNFDGLVYILHDPFELPSKNSKIMNVHYARDPNILIEPEMITIDESIYDYSPEE